MSHPTAINTINVIEMADEQVLGLAAFREDTDGNKDAAELFVAKMKEQAPESDPFSAKEIDDAVNEGIFEQGGYQLLLVHSTE